MRIAQQYLPVSTREYSQYGTGYILGANGAVRRHRSLDGFSCQVGCSEQWTYTVNAHMSVQCNCGVPALAERSPQPALASALGYPLRARYPVCCGSAVRH
jgi:hypothetical protein